MHAVLTRPPYVEFLASKSLPFADHPLATPNYQRKIAERGRNFVLDRG
jgi:hypothetical protein